MSELGREELLYELMLAFRNKRTEVESIRYEIPEKELNERLERINQAEEQIKVLIQRTEVTEEWIEEKARELLIFIDKPLALSDEIKRHMHFIRSLVGEIHGRK